MFVVTVNFKIRAGHEEAFREAVLDQARNSLRLEPDCQQFDVCRNPDAPGEVFLYEVYTAAFGARVKDLVDTKTVSTWERVGGARGA